MYTFYSDLFTRGSLKNKAAVCKNITFLHHVYHHPTELKMFQNWTELKMLGNVLVVSSHIFNFFSIVFVFWFLKQKYVNEH